MIFRFHLPGFSLFCFVYPIVGIFIIFIAAGLLGYGLHELGEVGWVPVGIEHLYDINSILNEKQGLGSFLKAIFGYNGNPSLTETVLYWLYLSAMLYFAFRPKGVVVASRS